MLDLVKGAKIFQICTDKNLDKLKEELLREIKRRKKLKAKGVPYPVHKPIKTFKYE